MPRKAERLEAGALELLGLCGNPFSLMGNPISKTTPANTHWNCFGGVKD